ncbi:hypothetical protein AXG93_2632s1140 [Marchantia polymorpha subsp. ruderalis]|uniref:Uncharacterized protein n=1 Tax=Marchantia polymorpha subsp. ruderalis TaxID=1480154 RepID=A0A176VWD5_MARPO|nr:hypothetical protein AXG93_2632s1140 [Marchantia polymorpha subsp. ruderalis]
MAVEHRVGHWAMAIMRLLDFRSVSIREQLRTWVLFRGLSRRRTLPRGEQSRFSEMVMTRATYKTVLNAGTRTGLISIMDIDEVILFLDTALATRCFDSGPVHPLHRMDGESLPREGNLMDAAGKAWWTPSRNLPQGTKCQQRLLALGVVRLPISVDLEFLWNELGLTYVCDGFIASGASSIENVGTLNAPGSISVPGDSRATVAAQPRNSTQSFAGGFGHFLTEISAT